ncbi:MAG: hypothetical protein LAT56_00255 [Wenzhouxiangella sp.]|nr:hypothetical protein [Wenzhouxiangella sp.]
MCGRKYAPTLWVLLLLFSLSSAGLSAEGFLITEEELTELERILERQQNTIENLQMRLDVQEITLNRLDTITESQLDLLSQQATTINGLKTSFDEYETGVRRRVITIGLLSGVTGLLVGTTITLIYR